MNDGGCPLDNHLPQFLPIGPEVLRVLEHPAVQNIYGGMDEYYWLRPIGERAYLSPCRSSTLVYPRAVQLQTRPTKGLRTQPYLLQLEVSIKYSAWGRYDSVPALTPFSVDIAALLCRIPGRRLWWGSNVSTVEDMTRRRHPLSPLLPRARGAAARARWLLTGPLSGGMTRIVKALVEVEVTSTSTSSARTSTRVCHARFSNIIESVQWQSTGQLNQGDYLPKPPHIRPREEEEERLKFWCKLKAGVRFDRDRKEGNITVMRRRWWEKERHGLEVAHEVVPLSDVSLFGDAPRRVVVARARMSHASQISQLLHFPTSTGNITQHSTSTQRSLLLVPAHFYFYLLTSTFTTSVYTPFPMGSWRASDWDPKLSQIRGDHVGGTHEAQEKGHSCCPSQPATTAKKSGMVQSSCLGAAAQGLRRN
ncbi:hypothetical protein DFH06DRAFT_1437846 [Mycena polygramma]|nr:hypothetical protein DFH06DRAFT_1437846 [Mycena polygramma]